MTSQNRKKNDSCYDGTSRSIWERPWEYDIYNVKIIIKLVIDICAIRA